MELPGFSFVMKSYGLVANPAIGIAIIVSGPTASLGAPKIVYLHENNMMYEMYRDLLLTHPRKGVRVHCRHHEEGRVFRYLVEEIEYL